MKEDCSKTILPNGVQVVSEHIPNVRSVSLGIWVTVGSRDEQSHENGISHFIEHMIFKGTERRSALDIAKAFDRVGGLSNAFTSRESTCFHAKVMDTHISYILDLLADIFLHSRFDPSEVERERQVILQEINMVEDTPDELVHELFGQFFWGDNGMGRSILGTSKMVRTISSEQMRRYVETAYIGPRVCIAAAGNIRHEAFARSVSSLFAEISAASGPTTRLTPIPKSGLMLYPRDLEQVHLVLGSRGPATVDDRRYAALILNVILGGSMSSRLFQEIREKRGLAYSIYSFLCSYRDAGLLGIYAGLAPNHVAQVTEIIIRELRRLSEEPLDETELGAARDHVKGGLLLSAENTDTRMTRLARNEIDFGRHISYEDAAQAIDQVTPEEVQALVGDCLTEGLSMVALGPVPELETVICQDLIAGSAHSCEAADTTFALTASHWPSPNQALCKTSN